MGKTSGACIDGTVCTFLITVITGITAIAAVSGAMYKMCDGHRISISVCVGDGMT